MKNTIKILSLIEFNFCFELKHNKYVQNTLAYT